MSKKRRTNIVIPEEPSKGPSLFVDIILLFIAPPISTIVGLYLLFKRFKYEVTHREFAEFRRYAAIIGDRSSISLRELAGRLGKSPGEVADDIQKMINQGIIDSRAYVDRSDMMLYMQDDVIETEFVSPTVNIYVNRDQAKSAPIETEFVAPAEKAAEKAAPKAEAVSPEPAKPARPKQEPRRTGTDNEDFEAKLREIRKLNDDIDNEVVSQRIDRIGALTASIFRVVREKPERAEEVRKFMNYYLPTTLKLLKSYSLMEKQSYQGENIKASRKQIEDVLDKLVLAFEKQQDRLFQNDMLDVETDISVLETMMTSDGLLEPRAAMRRRPVPAKPQAQAEEKPQEGATATMGGEG